MRRPTIAPPVQEGKAARSADGVVVPANLMNNHPGLRPPLLARRGDRFPLLKTADKYRKDLRKAWNDARRHLDEATIHDLRVATRRMSAVLLLLEAILGKDGASSTRRRTKRVMKRLGTLRDIQVQISIVKKWNSTDSARGFLESLEQVEKREKKTVRDYLSADRRKRLLRRLRDFERDAAKQLKKMPDATVQATLERVITQQRDDVKAADNQLARSDPQSLHALRIASRKLRYSLEATADTVGAAPESELEALRQRQTELGRKRDLQLLDEKYAEWQGV